VSTPDPVAGAGSGAVNPFPLEERGEQETQTVNPWNGPVQPKWYSGLGFNEDNMYMGPFGQALKGAGQGAAKGEELLGGLWHAHGALMSAVAPAAISKLYEGEESFADKVTQDARERVKALTPDPATTGIAANVIHGLASSITRYSMGSLAGGVGGAATLLGGTEALDRYNDLSEQGVTPGAATASAGIAGVAGAAGAVMPAGFGSSLIGKILTGGVSNVGFGLASRYADHAVLEAAGYHDMAAQTKVWDNTSVAADLVLGGAFGALAHVHGEPAASREAAKSQISNLEQSIGRGAPGAEDAAMATNLAASDRQGSPGVPATPAAANAHQAALETATQSLLEGKPVQVSDTGVADQHFIPRPENPRPEAVSLFMGALKEGGFLEQQGNLEQLEAQLGARLRGETPPELPPAKPAAAAEGQLVTGRPPAPPDRPTNPIDPAATDQQKLEQIHALTAENLPRVQAIVKDLNEQLPGTDSHESVKSDESIVAKAHRPEILAKRPWWGMEHLADTLRFKTVVDSLHDVPKILDTLKAHGVEMLKFDEDKLADNSPWGWRVLPMDLRMPNGQIVEHYIVGKHLNAAQQAEGHQLFENWRYKDRDQLSPHEIAQYMRDRDRSREIYTEAWRRDFERPGETLTDARASLDKAKAVAESLTSTRSPRGSVAGVPEPGPVQVSPSLRAKNPSRPVTQGSEPSGNVVTSSADTATTSSGILPQTVVTAAGRRLEVKPKVMELGDVMTSDHPDYPQELQPRQRGERAALSEQVADMARNLNPELLGHSPEADRGAPIVGPDNVVESGNGRALALRQAYAAHPDRAAAYRSFLERSGYDVGDVKQPILVRERTTPLDDAERRAFTVEANQTSVAALSPVERARADADKLDGGTLALLRNGDLHTAQNAPFVRAFLGKVTGAERNALLNPDGTVSQEGVRRIQAAILAKAYGGAPESNATLGRMLESTDNDMRSTMGALLDAAPAFAKLRQAIADGKVSPQYDLSRPLTQAIETAGQVRGKGQALSEYLKQGDMLTGRAPIVDALMKALYEKDRLAGREKVAQTLMKYADRAMKQRIDQSSLFAEDPLPPADLLEEKPGAGESKPDIKPAGDMFGLRTPQGKGPGDVSTQVAETALQKSPNMEIPDANGEMQRAGAELTGAQDATQAAEEKAPEATSIAANCFGQRSAA
jgi:hypothetical protein